jgi:hypothetical protein
VEVLLGNIVQFGLAVCTQKHPVSQPKTKPQLPH